MQVSADLLLKKLTFCLISNDISSYNTFDVVSMLRILKNKKGRNEKLMPAF